MGEDTWTAKEETAEGKLWKSGMEKRDGKRDGKAEANIVQALVDAKCAQAKRDAIPLPISCRSAAGFGLGNKAGEIWGVLGLRGRLLSTWVSAVR